MTNAAAILELITNLKSGRFTQVTGQLQRFPGDQAIDRLTGAPIYIDYNGHCGMGVESVCLRGRQDINFGDWHYDALNGKWRNSDEHLSVRSDKIPDPIAEQVFGPSVDSATFQEMANGVKWREWVDVSDEDRMMMLKGQPRYVWMNDVLGKTFSEIADQLAVDYAAELEELRNGRLTTAES